ncbi:Na+/H+ antiporter subunit E [Candidatus Bipolaricaulota bacterium]|nr:Na+/H+ antiporter subunit E [Candidatus Bipolaricaulota bacterium]
MMLFLIWLAMTRSCAVSYVIAGVASSLVVSAFWRIMMPSSSSSTMKLVRHPIRCLRFILVLARRFALSTLRTSWLILKGDEEGRMMALPIRVRDPLARFILLNSITLTPSTISLLAEDDLLYIHWLQSSAGKGDWREIKESLDMRLLSLFEEEQRAPR